MSVFLCVNLERAMLDCIAGFARAGRHELIECASTREAGQALGFYACDLVFFMLDSQRREDWPTMTSLAQLPGSPDIIALVRENDIEAGEFAIQSGCWDVCGLPCDGETLGTTVNRYLDYRRDLHKTLPAASLKRDHIIGNSPAIQRLLQRLAMIANTDSSVLILGETGTGKELFAKAVHENSSRAGKPLVVADCTNLPASLAESLLFGHARGSFTGAVESTEGLFKQADGGTIFLDEIGELDLNVQKSLLRVIQERRFRPLSAKREVSCDFRIIAATNQDLEAMVREGAFRQDLFHRINTQTITLPPLRERIEDIPTLAACYIAMFSRMQNMAPKKVAPETLEALKIYPWPGNIRELVNVCQAAALKAASSQRVYPQHLPEDIRLYLVRSKITSRQLTEKASRHGGEPEDFTSGNIIAGHGFAGSRLQGGAGAFANPAPFGNSEIERFDTGASPAMYDFSAKPEIMAAGGSKDNYSAARDNMGGREAGPAARRFDAGPPDTELYQPRQTAGKNLFNFSGRETVPSYKQARNEAVTLMEGHYLDALVQAARGSFARAQAFSGLSRARLYELLKKHRRSI